MRLRRRRKTEENSGHERWLVSYADFITLMFAFFVMMYANSKTDQERAQQISEAFKQALSQGGITQTFAKLVKRENPPPAGTDDHPMLLGVTPPEIKGAQTVELLPSLQQLNETLKKEIEAGRLAVNLERRGLVISLREATFFPSGNDTVEPSTIPTLETIATELKRTPNPIRLEGHTDSIPISNARFRSNWDLSAARGIAMLDLFRDRFGIAAERMAIAGFAETAPVAPNATPEGRARNRRVDIVVLNEEASLVQPVQSKSGPVTGP